METMKTQILTILDSLDKETNKIKCFKLVHKLKELSKEKKIAFRKAYIEIKGKDARADKIGKVLFLNGDYNKLIPNKEYLAWEKQQSRKI